MIQARRPGPWLQVMERTHFSSRSAGARLIPQAAIQFSCFFVHNMMHRNTSSIYVVDSVDSRTAQNFP